MLVGTAGFELATPCTPCKCATRLRYAPKERDSSTDFPLCWNPIATSDRIDDRAH